MKTQNKYVEPKDKGVDSCVGSKREISFVGLISPHPEGSARCLVGFIVIESVKQSRLGIVNLVSIKDKNKDTFIISSPIARASGTAAIMNANCVFFFHG